ncbi:flavin reductase family protein [Amycolatopsis sp. NPDC021455]|uniref:flavin reductase family protein n=1 Tax=Amycolatopsis sp. NPDC021455 TaxID=3154901 RepID=UPI0033CE9A08
MSSVVESVALRRVLGNFATGVTVVATDTATGPAGLVVNSFSSVSLDPPLVLFCIARNSRTWPRIAESGHFAISFLGDDQERVARRFCLRDVDRFAGEDLLTVVTGAPVLAAACAYVDCVLDEVHDAGDHHIVVGAVVAAAELRRRGPLLFVRGSYR